MSEYLFTSESVSEGHPDKMADQISDALVDALLRLQDNEEQRQHVRAACETMVKGDNKKGNCIILGGEIRSPQPLLEDRMEEIVRGVVRGIGYDNPECGFDAGQCAVHNFLGQQSADIALGVDKAGAGDQGIMFGFACRETESLMPLPIDLSHRLMLQHRELRRGKLPWLRPDAKSQVSVVYRDGKPQQVNAVVLSTQHTPEIDGVTVAVHDKRLREAVVEEIIRPVIKELLSPNCAFHINPTGLFVDGGPVADCGLTGRKIIVDTYGGAAPHGGGAFSGKDPTKVDRSAAYMLRHVAKSIVAAGYADSCLVQAAYAIGVPEPVSLLIRPQGGSKPKSAEALQEMVGHAFDLTPAGIIRALKLHHPIYQETAAFGHFGRTPAKTADGETFTWEQVREL